MVTDTHAADENRVLRGVPASPGLVTGSAQLYRRVSLNLEGKRIPKDQVGAELEKFREACGTVEKELDRIASIAQKELGDATSAIISSHIEVLRDPELLKLVQTKIRQLHAADAAVYDSFELFLRMMRASGNSLFVERAADISDVRDRIISRIQHTKVEMDPVRGCILVTDDLTPTEVVELVRAGVSGFVLNAGGRTSHASIIARSMEIPAVAATQTATSRITDGDVLIVDGHEGLVFYNPDTDVKARYKKQEAVLANADAQIEKLSNIETVTRCGRHIRLRANIEFADELLKMDRFGAQGIGLLRTESFFMNQNGEGTLSESAFYEQAVLAGKGEPVTIRVYDVGGDKIVDSRMHEPNPFLGWRGVRILLDKQELLREQLRNILGVAGRYPGRVRILVPMVTFIDEFRRFKTEVTAVQEELRQQGIPVDETVRVGIMVEVPAVVLQLPVFAREADFFSIGTNDLTQYTLAVDRGNPVVSDMFRQLHPSVLRLIQLTADAAQAAGVPVAVCGEAASDPLAAALFIAMGIHDLSMTPSAIPRVKEALLRCRVETIRTHMEDILGADQESDVRNRLERLLMQEP